MKTRGFVIILVLAILLLLALLAITYVTLSMTDRTIARNYMDNKRAKLIAQSGVDYAIAKAQEDLCGTGWQNLLSKSIKINGVDTNYTESAGSTYGENRDIFKVEIRDSNSMINVNDGLDNERVKGNLKRILNNLGEIVGVAQLGDKIINKRPQTGYSSKQELLRAVNITEFDSIKDFVTTHSWQDDNVANPVPLSSAVTDYYPVYYRTPASFRYGRGVGSLLFAPEAAAGSTNNHILYGLDELNPQWIEIVSRSPVNINNADPEVLAALIKDLKGFFVLERRKSTPYWELLYDIYSFEPDFPSEPGAGYIYTTPDIDITKAQQIANEIKNCRDQTGNYATEWYRGNFKSFRQFNVFCDDLVSKFAIITDTRTDLFYDWNNPITVPPFALEASTLATRYANQAIADLFKANFNPNLNLNELNPDANIASANGGLVDKTDLIVNSTEFCFTPMGYFQIESEGYILKAKGLDNVVIASSKIEAVVKLYDCYRETNQKQFLAGQIPNTATNTNNGKTLEIGPEPSVTPAQETLAKENEWGGYIALPTLKGQDGLPLATLTAHYTANLNADFHAGDAPNNLNDQNVADPTEVLKSPYGYGQTSASGLPHTLAKSYRQGDGKDTTKRYAVSDLRIDGAYVERESGLAYDISFSDGLVGGGYQFDCKVIRSEGVVSYWIKPSFRPQLTARPRCFFSMTSIKSQLADVGTPINQAFTGSQYGIRSFGNWFCTSYLHDSYASKEQASYVYNSAPSFPQVSLVFGYSYQGVEDIGQYSYLNTCRAFGIATRSLNHLHHQGNYCGSKINYLAQGHWTHVVLTWDFSSAGGDPVANPKIFINGRDMSLFSMDVHTTGPNGPMIPTWFEFIYTMRRIKIGEPSTAETTGSPPNTVDPIHFSQVMRQNYTSDSTIDEFYVFQENSTFDARTAAQQMYLKGRYYCPQTTDESSYTSASLTSKLFERAGEIADKSLIANPSGGSFGFEVNSISSQRTKIIGLSWAWCPEFVEKNLVVTTTTGVGKKAVTTTTDYRGKSIIKNYKDYDKTQSSDPSILTTTFLYPEVKIQLIKNSETPIEYKDDSFSSADIELTGSDSIRYIVIINIPGVASDTLLLYSPIFDDLTIFYSSGIRFISYSWLD